MKIKVARDIGFNSQNLTEGDEVDLPDAVASRWVELGYGYEIKPHVERPAPRAPKPRKDDE